MRAGVADCATEPVGAALMRVTVLAEEFVRRAESINTLPLGAGLLSRVTVVAQLPPRTVRPAGLHGVSFATTIDRIANRFSTSSSPTSSRRGTTRADDLTRLTGRAAFNKDLWVNVVALVHVCVRALTRASRGVVTAFEAAAVGFCTGVSDRGRAVKRLQVGLPASTERPLVLVTEPTFPRFPCSAPGRLSARSLASRGGSS